MSLMLTSVDDIARRRALNRMRGAALALLIVAAVVFLATLRVADSPGWEWLHAATEAAMVGGLADWFAVTALFRRPLGLPIPHTAIIPRRKNDIGRQLQHFVNDNFLTEEVVRERLAQVHVTVRAGEWLAAPTHRKQVLDLAARLTRIGLARISDDEIASLIGGTLLPRLAIEPLSPVAGLLLERVIADGSHVRLVDLALSEMHDWLADNAASFERVMGERAPRWSPRWVDRRVTDYAYRQVLAWVADVRDEPDHAARQAFDRFLARLGTDLQNDAEVMRRFAVLQERLLAHPQVLMTAKSLWQSVRRSAEAVLDDPGSELWTRADRLIGELATKLTTDQALQSRLDARIADAASWVVNNYGRELTQVISTTIERWDPKQASERIELHVGRDLQFIRINGTVVGALAGLAIHAVAVLIGKG